jgi:hypothetical protein
VGRPATDERARKSPALAAAIALGLIALEVYRWGPSLRAATREYLLQPMEYQWFGLPVEEQTPMSLWNRTPMQALVSAGLPPATAQMAALALWLLFLAITLRRAWRAPLTFPLAFALSFLLLYWGRPVGWTLAYLELVVVAAVWPRVQGWQQPALAGGAIVLMASRWWALALTARGEGMPFTTLQSAAFPWETWIVLPLCWLLLLSAIGDFLPRCAFHKSTRLSAKRAENG